MQEGVQHTGSRMHQLQRGNVRILWYFVLTMQWPVVLDLCQCVVSSVSHTYGLKPSKINLIYFSAVVVTIRLTHVVKAANKFTTYNPRFAL